MTRCAGAIPLAVTCGALILGACVEIPTGSNDVLSIQFLALPSPSVVVGDTLRDSSGVVSPVKLIAYNYTGGTVTSPTIRYTAIDRGIRVDSVSGIVVGDSVRSVARILATVKSFNGSVTIAVTFRPDTVIGSNARDSLSYSLTDTAANVSAPMGVRLIHGKIAGDTSVSSYRVSFRIVSPADVLLARLVDDSGNDAGADTTDASGVAARRVKVDVTRLAALVDSVVVEAKVKYRGVDVKGSPARLVLKVKPK